MVRKPVEALDRIAPEYVIYKGDEKYPERLKNIPLSPSKLYVRGALPKDDVPSVAIVGARNCSLYGQDMAKWFATELALNGVQIVSGMARGIDGISQWTALRAGGESFGVLGCGTDICYPPENYGIYESLLKNGGIISEFPSSTQPIARNFPSRNRIISALADILIVVEAREKSGTIITVDYALSQGKEVFAIPGRLGEPLSAGCNALIYMGASMALSPADILEALGINVKNRVMSLKASIQYGEKRIREKQKNSSEGHDNTSEDQNNITERSFKETSKEPDSHKKLLSSLRKVKGKNEINMPGTMEDSPPELIFELSGSERPVWQALNTEPASVQDVYDRLNSQGSDPGLPMPELINILMGLVMKGAASGEGGLYGRKEGVKGI